MFKILGLLKCSNVKGVISSFDYKEKRLVVNKNKFGEVCDYEN